MKHLIITAVMLATTTLMLPSCKDKESYESNALILKKAIEAGNKGEWEKAQLLALRARTQDPNDANARVMLALALEQDEKLDQAIEEIKVATTLDHSIFMAQYTQGRLLFKNDIYEDCPAPLEKAKELNPNHSQVLLLLARTYSLLSNYDESIKNYILLARLKQYSKSAEVFNEIGVLFFKKKDYKRSIKFFERAYSMDPKLPSLNLNFAVFYETLAELCKDDKSKAFIARRNAVKYYGVYEQLLILDPHAEDTRKAIIDKIAQLKETM